MNHVICIPLHHNGGRYKNDRELRYALRSIAKNFQCPYDIVIVGRKLPRWIKGVGFLKCGGGLKTALKTASESFPNGFFWYYDDCCMLRPMTSDEMKVTPCSRRINIDRRTNWTRNLTTIKSRLDKLGLEAWDYSRPHGPYWFDKEMVDEAFSDWEGMAGKFPFESWILSKRQWPRRSGVVRQVYGDFKMPRDMENAWFLNYSHDGATSKMMDYLLRLFPEQSPFEADEQITEMRPQAEYIRKRKLAQATLA